MPKKIWTPEEKQAFKEKMAAARIKKRGEPSIVKVEETVEEKTFEPGLSIETPAEVQPEVSPVLEADENFVIFKSADNRKLELSIGGQTWNDFEIKVPKEVAITARRSLEEGGFFLKD